MLWQFSGQQKPHTQRTPINLSYPTNTIREPAQGLGERYEQSRLDRSTGRRNALGNSSSGERVRGVPANVIHSLNELDEANSTFIADGYEGSILRSPHGLYKFGRSTVNEGFLLKMKIFEDAEFKIVGFVEMMHNENEATKDALGNTERSSHKAGKVKSGILGSLVVEYGDDTFEVGTGFSHAQRKEIFENQLDYIGKDAKIQYQKEGMMDFPRFPSFKGIRDVEDFENGYEKGVI